MAKQKEIWSCDIYANFIDITTLEDVRKGRDPVYTMGRPTVEKDGEGIAFDTIKDQLWELLERGKTYRLVLVER